MRLAQVLVYESDGKLAQLLRPGVEQRGWRLRELRHAEAVPEVLREGGPVLVLKLGRDLYEELSLLERVSWTWPETAIVVVTNSEHPELTALIWELGAVFVQRPGDPLANLSELVSSLINSEASTSKKSEENY